MLGAKYLGSMCAEVAESAVGCPKRTLEQTKNNSVFPMWCSGRLASLTRATSTEIALTSYACCATMIDLVNHCRVGAAGYGVSRMFLALALGVGRAHLFTYAFLRCVDMTSLLRRCYLGVWDYL